jgi:ubiquinone/menaquinone biosynthesis C-methylase UbiE
MLLVCPSGHGYPCVGGIPVLVVDELEPTQPRYWATPEQIDAALSSAAHEADDQTVDPYVKQLLVGTHGNLYRRLAEKTIERYPVPTTPLPPGEGRLLLDIGCNWGRWSIAAARAGYRVVGIDPSFEAVAAARRIAHRLEVPVEYVVADARALPFGDGTFDTVFSYSVLQHFAKPDARAAVAEMARVLRAGGTSWIQMANARGLRNLQQRARRGFREGDAFEVRYWTPRELKQTFAQIGPTRLLADGFFTLNGQVDDVDLLPARYRAIVRGSVLLRRTSMLLPLLARLADSVVLESVRA